jgi:multidrug transporter EmrE-like cation transporter
MGREVLIKLAEEPSVRLRVLNYAEELDLLSEISLEQQGEIARAESHLAIWLSEPLQMGIAPSNLELVDSRELYWPSYEHPVVCYLFQFEYGAGENTYSNLAICGPMVHAFTADLKSLPLDDVYALFAGWQTVHDEIFQMSPERAEQAFGNQWRTLNLQLEQSEDFEDRQALFLASFFGKLALVAQCTHADKPGTLIVDTDSSSFIEQGNPTAPIDADLAYAIWRGRQLLSTFNPAFDV